MAKKKEGYSDSELPMLLQSMASLGLVVVVCVGGFFFLGFMLDKYFSVGVTGIVASTFLGAVFAIYWAYKRVSTLLYKIYKNQNRDEMMYDDSDDDSGSEEF